MTRQESGGAHQLHAAVDVLSREVLERLVEALQCRDGEAIVQLSLEGANLRGRKKRVIGVRSLHVQFLSPESLRQLNQAPY